MVKLSEFTVASRQLPGIRVIDFEKVLELNDDAFRKLHLQMMREYESILWKGEKIPTCTCCGEKIVSYSDLSRVFGACYHSGCLLGIIDDGENLTDIHKKYLQRVYEILGLGEGEFQLEFEF